MDRLLITPSLNFDIPNLEAIQCRRVDAEIKRYKMFVFSLRDAIYHGLLNGHDVTQVADAWQEYVEEIFSIFKQNSNLKFFTLGFRGTVQNSRNICLVGISSLLSNMISTGKIGRAYKTFETIVDVSVPANIDTLLKLVESPSFLETLDSSTNFDTSYPNAILSELESLQLSYENLHINTVDNQSKLLSITEERNQLLQKCQWLRSKKRKAEDFLEVESEKVKKIENENYTLAQEVDRLSKLAIKLEAENSKLLQQLRSAEIRLKRVTEKSQMLKNDLEFKTLELLHSKNIIRKMENNTAFRAANKVKNAIGKLTGKNGDRELEAARQLLEKSELFDSEWYLKAYPDVSAMEVSPEIHYITLGFLEGRQPSKHFDGVAYLRTYKDVAEQGINPLFHYLTHGRNEGRVYQSNLLELSNRKIDE